MLKSIYENASIVWSGRYHTTVNELTDQIPALRPRVLWHAASEIVRIGDFLGNKMIVEEEKAAHIGAVVSLMTGLPLAMARMYPYEVPGIRVSLQSEYLHGHLYVNGIEAGDEVSIVEDTISTGGTLIALINGIIKAGARVRETIALIEKVDNGGVQRVYEQTGIEVKTVQKIKIVNDKVCVV